MKKEIKWNLLNGKEAVYTVELITSKPVDLDGDKMTVPCCEICESMSIPGIGYISAHIAKCNPIAKNGKTIVAIIGGKVGIEKTAYDAIMSAKVEVKSDPVYVAKIDAEKENRRQNAEFDAHRKRNGYCYKCHSYCYGDCEAN